MAEPEKPLAFTADFPGASRETWRKLVDGVLKGAPFERLVGTTYDRLKIEPLPPRRPDAEPIKAREGVPWQVLTRIDQPDPALANAAARRELEGGATGLSLVFAGAIGDHGFGLPPGEQTLARVLEDVDIAGTAVELDVSPEAEAAIDAALAKDLMQFRSAKALRIGHDPLGAMALAGGAMRHWRDQAPHFARRLAALARDGVGQKLAVADGRVIHNAGGSEAQELAFALAAALAYLRALETAALPLEQARRMIFFRLAADADQFLTIAKFRAMRKLWTSVEVACGLSPAPAFVTAETAWRMMTQRDPHVNMLRATIAVFAAAVGGADAISVLPFTSPLGLPDEFARRNARNTQLVLRDESNLAKVADAAAGSGAVEDLTDQLCAAAWTLFQEIETAGGPAAALESGTLQSKVAAVRARRQAATASGKDALTGASIFPALDEMQVVVLERISPRSAALRRPTTISWQPLAPIRLAEPFEALRDASDKILAESGARPKAFLACLGTEAEFAPRATFAANFFAAGGIEAVAGRVEVPAISDAFAASGAKLVCLCGTDKTYESAGANTAAALKAAGARYLYVAGRPGALEPALRNAGVQFFIYEGCDALAVLEATHGLIAS